jgi:hypothetical protein
VAAACTQYLGETKEEKKKKKEKEKLEANRFDNYGGGEKKCRALNNKQS